MQEQQSRFGVIHFQLFGVPVVIEPFSWVMLAILGGLFSVDDVASMKDVLFFVVAGMLCLLTHEFGHALVGRKLNGGLVAIEIAGLGGVTYHEHARRGSMMSWFLTVLAGPLASLLLGLVGGVLLGLQIGNVWGGVELAFTLPLPGDALSQETYEAVYEALQSGVLPKVMLSFYFQLFLVCFWWSVFNLLPIMPLDGGRLLGMLLRNELIVCYIGLGICGLLGVLSIVMGMWFNVIIVGYLGWINWQILRQYRG